MNGGDIYYLTFQQLKNKMSSRSLSYTKFHKRRNDQKGWNTMAHFLENCKKVKIEVPGPKKEFFLESFQIN